MRGEREFVSEISALTTFKHDNLVTLKGCCVDGAKRLLVYNYMENNSLAQILLGGEKNRIKLDWEARRAISLGVARGLAYLHEEVKPRIVHRDIKASNILLDQNLVPKFRISTVVDFDLEHGEHYLVQKAWEIYRDNRILQLVDPIVGMNYPHEDAIRFIKVGLLCIQEKSRLRPEMSTALKMLSNDVDIERVQVSQPGLVADLMNIKFGQKTTFHSLYSKASNLENTPSPLSSCS
ncbi:putative serine/threonine-protein kinase [Hibiscus syriacus]|uniref:non-specific serine/threonine protein kinase n=1 Tax=Hibiscus syriacus TaxID=106335 RepID=A0A6A3D0Y5_HIBSY|nr:putative serine/threonine-protein kinase [Hibiscus syriacus]